MLIKSVNGPKRKGDLVMSTMVDLLSRTRSYVARGWTQGADARDEFGKVMMWHEEGAECWCLSGALRWASQAMTDERNQVRRMLWRAGRALSYPMDLELGISNSRVGPDHDRRYRCVLEHFNDEEGRTQDEVLALVDKALEIVTKETIKEVVGEDTISL